MIRVTSQRNHMRNKPSEAVVLDAMLAALKENPEGLSVAQLQTQLFYKFHYRLDGPELTKLVGNNPTKLQMRRRAHERVFITQVSISDSRVPTVHGRVYILHI